MKKLIWIWLLLGTGLIAYQNEGSQLQTHKPDIRYLQSIYEICRWELDKEYLNDRIRLQPYHDFFNRDSNAFPNSNGI